MKNTHYLYGRGKKAAKQHTVFTSPAFAWSWNDKAVAETDLSLLDPSQAPSHTQTAAGGEPSCQHLGSFLSPLGEHSPNLGVSQVTLQEGASSQIKFSRR